MAEDIETIEKPLDIENTEEQPIQQKSVIDEIDKDALATHILNLLKNDIRDRETFGWDTKLQYDQLAYDGYKQKADEPWANASNYAVCLTSTLLDTGHANVIGGIFANSQKIVNVTGVGPEDVRNEKNLETYINWLISNDIPNSYNTIDRTVHRAFKHGNAIIKVIRDLTSGKIMLSQVPIEYIFLPIDAKGAQVEETDHIFQLIPLTENDVNYRKTLKDNNGAPVYDGLDDLAKGSKVYYSSAIDSLQNVNDFTSGTSLGQRYARDMYYILECYLTYWFKPKDSEKDEYKKVELIVSISSQGGKILRMDENKQIDDETEQAVRPYSVKWRPYPRDDRFYGDSLPWLVKQTQEELDYAHNQNMNAAEELIKPPKFYDPSSGFDPENYQMTPNGWYPITDPSRNIHIPIFNFNPIFERSFDRYWEYAQRRTGFTELFQGRRQDSGTTLGEAQIRTNKTEIRFKAVYDRFEQGFKELMGLIYFYAKKLPKDIKIKVLGTSDYLSIEELFPNGVRGDFNFSFSSEPLTEEARKAQDVMEFYTIAAINPLVQQSPANMWRLLNMVAESKGIQNMSSIVSKPKEAYILGPEEAIQRIMSGQYNLKPDPEIDTLDYKLRMGAFILSDSFKNATMEEKMAIQRLYSIVEKMDQAQMLAMQDAMLLKQKSQIDAMSKSQGMLGQNVKAAQPNIPQGVVEGAPIQ